MKKRLIAIILTMVMVMSLAACKKGEDKTENPAPTAAVQDTNKSDTGNSSAAAATTNDADKKDASSESDVFTFRIKKADMSVDTQEDLDEIVAKEGFISGTLDDDGMVTLVMDKQRHDMYIRDVKEAIEGSLTSIPEDAEYTPNIIGAEANSDYSVITFKCSGEEITLMEKLAGYSMLMYADLYNVLMGTPEPAVKVAFINVNTNSEIEVLDDVNGFEELFLELFSGFNDDFEIEEVDYPYTVVSDNEMFSFAIQSIDANGEYGYTLNAVLTNKTDKAMNFSADTASVNDWAFSLWWGEDVEPGATLESEIHFAKYNFKECGITDVFGIEFDFIVRESDDWFAENAVREHYTIYPHGENNYEKVDYEIDEEAYVLTLTDYYKMVITSMNFDSLWGSYQLDLYIENTCDQNLTFSIDNVSANEWMCPTSAYESIPAGKRTLTTLAIPGDVIEMIGVDVPTAIELSLTVTADDLYMETLADDMFTIYPNGYDYYELNPVKSNIERAIEVADVVLEDNDDYSFVITGMSDDEYDYVMNIILTNKTDGVIYFRLNDDEDVLINGQPIFTYLSEELLPGKSDYKSMYWSKDEWGEYGIDLVETIDLPIVVMDTVTYTDIYKKTYHITAE